MSGRRPAATDPAATGFFGKVPTRGDFVSRRLGGALHGALDQWLSRALVASRRQLGEAWLPAYLVAPVWRFVLGRGTMGPHPAAGVLMPSVDRVGRYFPLVLAAEMPGLAEPWRLFRSAGDWFDAAEARARACLDDDVDLDAFEAGLAALGLPEPPPAVPDAPRRYGLGGEVEAIRAYADALDAALAGSRGAVTLWWTKGSEAVAPSLLLHRGVPAPEQFAAFLDGRWADRGWQDWTRQAASCTPAVPIPAAAEPLAPRAAPEAVRLVSAARTHRGTRRPRNDDAVVDRPDLGLWAVADGAGGHAAADVAAAAVAERLSGLPAGPGAPGRGTIEALLAEANEALRARARRLGPDAVVAAVVVVLMIRAGRYAVAWAGDARAYLLRGRKLVPLTRDHATREGRKVVTRAVGAEDAFALDWAEGAVRAGDRFVLCSDGLVGALGERGLAQVAGHGSPSEAAASTIDDALIAGARDNVSVVVVDAAGEGSEAR
ncbi:type VI secretion system-associated protein TagF [Methylobacterium tarhaniae]|uniref:type VI secretion system-associated protein TagF n=1 Tax=Methylobacterium tarhaniae TaxID=1187852 RepID=UPI00069E1C22|nr:type VI secretion system-associated protein TagF [Methylobacterium tarhaniae]